MPEVNARGWPSHAETDSVAEWAETSKALADKLAADVPDGLGGLRVEARRVTLTGTAGGWVSVIFQKQFGGVPVVVAVPSGASGYAAGAVQYVGGVSSAGFDFGGVTPGASVTVAYIAIGAR